MAAAPPILADEPLPAQTGGEIATEAATTADIAPADDYYTKRARKIIEREQRARDKEPHPLTLPHPDKFVVVCEAGCSQPDVPEIVAAVPRQEGRDAAMLVTTAAELGHAAETSPSLIECLGGCYGSSRAYHSRAPLPRMSTSEEADAAPGTWMTTVAPTTGLPPRRDRLSPVR